MSPWFFLVWCWRLPVCPYSQLLPAPISCTHRHAPAYTTQPPTSHHHPLCLEQGCCRTCRCLLQRSARPPSPISLTKRRSSCPERHRGGGGRKGKRRGRPTGGLAKTQAGTGRLSQKEPLSYKGAASSYLALKRRARGRRQTAVRLRLPNSNRPESSHIARASSPGTRKFQSAPSWLAAC
jgi:hypothetical protein